MKENIEVKEITTEDKIPYEWMTTIYGHAEFVICPVFKYGRLTDIYLYRRQQVEYNGYHIDLLKEKPTLRMDEFLLEGRPTNTPVIWRNWWCKEHKAVAFDTYVPKNTNTIRFDAYGGNSLRVQFTSSSETGNQRSES